MSKKKKVEKTPSQLEKELVRVQEKLATVEPGTPDYKTLLDQGQAIESLLEKVEGRENPPEDKISKADWLKCGLSAAMFAVSFVPELKGHVTMKSPLRRLIDRPRLWGNDIETKLGEKMKK